MPTGGVEPTEENLLKWFMAGVFCVGMGSQLITNEIIESKDYNALKEKIRVTMEIIRKLKT